MPPKLPAQAAGSHDEAVISSSQLSTPESVWRHPVPPIKRGACEFCPLYAALTLRGTKLPQKAHCSLTIGKCDSPRARSLGDTGENLAHQAWTPVQIL